MARTRRKHSYRKSKRWNPRSRSKTRSWNPRGRKSRRRNCGRNPSGPRDHQNDIETKRYPAPHRRNPVTYTKHLSDGSKVEVTRDGQVTVYDRNGVFSRYEIGYGRLAHFINDVKRAGRRADKYSFHGETLKDEGSYQVQLNPRRRRHGRRRNPAQFPMPFMSAMNPRRRGRKGRNPKISRREAKAMHRVLRRHGR